MLCVAGLKKKEMNNVKKRIFSTFFKQMFNKQPTYF